MSKTWLGPVLGTLLVLKTWLGPVLVSSYGPAALDFHKPIYLPKNRISYVDGPIPESME